MVCVSILLVIFSYIPSCVQEDRRGVYVEEINNKHDKINIVAQRSELDHHLGDV